MIGDVRGRTCIIQDDIIDTAGTIVKAAQALKDAGAERVLACAVHGVLSGPAIERIEAAPHREADRHQHDPARRRACAVREDYGALGRAPARAGDSQHSRGDVGLLVVRLDGAVHLAVRAAVSGLGDD